MAARNTAGLLEDPQHLEDEDQQHGAPDGEPPPPPPVSRSVQRLALSAGLVLGFAGLFYLVIRPADVPLHSKALPSTAARLIALHRPPPTARPGDWRRGPGREELGQTYEAWQRAAPTTARGVRRVLYVMRIGPFGDAQAAIFDQAAVFLGDYFGLPVRRLEPLAVDATWPSEATRARRGQARPQLNSRWLLTHRLASRLPADGAALLAFTCHDLWPGDGWNFVFGQASLHDRVGVWSLARFGDPAGGATARLRCLRRTLKVAMHETGHMVSIEHCRAYACAMAGSNSLAETDRAPLWLCPECVAKVWSATGVQPAARFEALARRCATWGLDAEAAFFGRSAEALREP